MPFVYQAPYQTAAPGSVEVVFLTSSDNTLDPFSVTIVGAVYGTPNNAVIAADGLSVSMTIQAGVAQLFLTVTSPSANDGALLTQPPNPTLYEFFLTDHWDACRIPINGVAAAAAAPASAVPNA
jgi:hypothetical protein